MYNLLSILEITEKIISESLPTVTILYSGDDECMSGFGIDKDSNILYKTATDKFLNVRCDAGWTYRWRGAVVAVDGSEVFNIIEHRYKKCI